MIQMEMVFQIKALSRTDEVEPGDIKVKDINNDGVINSEDRIGY